MRNQSKTRQSADEACEFQLQPGFTAAQCVAHRMTPGGSRVQQNKKGGGGGTCCCSTPCVSPVKLMLMNRNSPFQHFSCSPI